MTTASVNAAASVIRDLQRLFPRAVETHVPLSKISRWRIGGLADVVVSPRNAEELSKLRAWINTNALPSVVIGATSNLLFADEGLRAIAIRIGPDFASLFIDERRIIAGPGVWVPGLARKAMLAGLTGLEHTCGIPGTLGGLVCMNGGSQRKGIGSHVIGIDSVGADGTVRTRSKEQCDFAYRASVFQESNEVISQITLRLESTADKAGCRHAMLSVLQDRRAKFPRKLPSCGSTFVSNPAMYAEYGPPGKVIEASGFKGYRVGNAVVSPVHANFIINDLAAGGASARDVLRLISTVRNKVAADTGYSMEVEVRYVSPDGQIVDITA